MNDYDAPLEKLPLFVKGGAIIPMYPEMLYDNEVSADTLTLDCYPYNQSSFMLYEDDGLTREHRTGSFAKQTFTMDASSESIVLNIGESIGTYNGKYENRVYTPQFHIINEPEEVTIDGMVITHYGSYEEWTNAIQGWYFGNNVAYIKTPLIPTDTVITIELLF